MRRRLPILFAVSVIAVAGALFFGRPAHPHARAVSVPPGIHKIRHVVIVMQENRSFDSYFGTYPGTDGIPRGVCVPDPLRHVCERPYHDHADRNFGGPGFCSALLQLNGSSRFVQCADHSETMNRCAGRLHDAFGSNMWSWSTKLRAYAQ